MAPEARQHIDTRYYHTAAHINGLPGSAQTLSGSNVDRQQRAPDNEQLNTDPYMIGYLDGLAARDANTVAGANTYAPEAGVVSSSAQSDSPWPITTWPNVPDGWEPPGGSAGLPHNSRHTNEASSLFQIQAFPSDAQLDSWPGVQQEPVPWLSDFGSYGDPLNCAPATSVPWPPPYMGYELFQESAGLTVSSACQPSLAVETDVALHGHPITDLPGPELNVFQQLAPNGAEWFPVPSLEPAAHGFELLDDFTPTTLLATEESALVHPTHTIDTNTNAPLQEHLSERELLPGPSAASETRRSERRDSCVPSVCIRRDSGSNFAYMRTVVASRYEKSRRRRH